MIVTVFHGFCMALADGVPGVGLRYVLKLGLG